MMKIICVNLRNLWFNFFYLFSVVSALSVAKFFYDIVRFLLNKIGIIWYNIYAIGGNDSRQEREERGDPHAKEQPVLSLSKGSSTQIIY